MEQVSLSCTCRPRLSSARHRLRHVGHGALSGLSDSRLLCDGRLHRPTSSIQANPQRLSNSRHCLVPLYVALLGAAPSRMGHPHHHPSCKSTHALVPKAMETPQTSLSRSNPSAMLGQYRSPLPSCGEIRTVEDLGASNSPYFTATHEWGGQFQHGNWHLTHCMPRKGRFTTMNSMRPTTSIFFKNRQAFYLRFYFHPFRHG